MRALVVGGAGFVGGYLIQALTETGHEVFATKLASESLPLPVKSYDLDLEDEKAVMEVLEKTSPNVIFHLAAQSSVKLSWKAPALTTRINALGAVHLFEGIRALCPQARTLVIGSSEEYGSAVGMDVTEETVPRPNNVYALTKYFQEELARLYAKAYGLQFVLTRSFNHIGPRQAANFVVADFCAQVARIEAGKQEAVIRVGNLDARRDFTDVRDVVSAYLLLAEQGRSGEVYNVGSGNCIRIGELLDLVLSYSKREIKVETDPDKFRPAEIPAIRANVEKLQALGWRPKYSVKETVFTTLEYFRGITK